MADQGRSTAVSYCVQAGNTRILNVIHRLADVLERRTKCGFTELSLAADLLIHGMVDRPVHRPFTSGGWHNAAPLFVQPPRRVLTTRR